MYYRISERAIMYKWKTTLVRNSILEGGYDYLTSGDLAGLEPVENLINVRERFNRNHRLDDTLSRGVFRQRSEQ